MQIAIVLYPGMTALDAIGPYEVLRTLPGARVCFVSRRRGPVLTDSGVLELVATHALAEVPAPDILLVPGASSGTRAALADTELLAWLRSAHETSRWTLSVCTGALLLGAAGLLQGLPATTHWATQGLLPRYGATPQPTERIVRAGRIVTAAGVSAGIDLALWLAGELFDREQAEVSQLMIEYDPQPPFDTGHPSKASKAQQRRAIEAFTLPPPSARESDVPVSAMNHFTILTDDLESTLSFYEHFLGLVPGPRPDFSFPGAWLYARGGHDAILHVVAGKSRDRLVSGVIDHMAFTARDLPGAVARLQARGLPYDLRRLPGEGDWQLFFHDPNGARVEMDFDRSEPAPA